MGGLYDILESYRQQNDPRFIYDGLYQDPLYNIATANPLKAMSPGYEYRNSDAINKYLKSGAYDMSGNVPADYDRAIDFKRYFEDRPLKTLNYGNRFQDFKPRVGFPNTSVFGITPENFSTTGIMQQAPQTVKDTIASNLLYEDLPSGIDTSYGVANEEDVEQVDSLTGEKKSGGILDLIMSIAVPGYGFLKNMAKGGFEGIRGLNQRIQQSDFGRSKTLADYFDARRYGGRDERDAAAARNMVQARGIQKKIDRGEYGTASAQDKARGQMPSRTTSAPKRSFSSDYSAAQRARKF